MEKCLTDTVDKKLEKATEARNKVAENAAVITVDIHRKTTRERINPRTEGTC